MPSVICSLALVLVASCYSPAPAPGAPCTPGRESCPSDQTCELVAGAHVCVAGSSPDVSPDAPGDAAPAGPWTLVQTRISLMQRRVTIAASGAAHLLVVALQTNLNAVTSVTDDAGNTYVPIPGSRAIDMIENTGVELWYAANAKASARTISAEGDTIYVMAAWEVAGIRATSPLDAVSKLDSQPTSTTPAGPSITTSAGGEFVVSVVIVANTVTGVAAGDPFTIDHFTFGNGWAHLTSAIAPAGTYQARWDQPQSGTSCATAAAFFAGP